MSQAKRLVGYPTVEGKILILIGGRGSGKTETAKQLCKELRGPKSVFELNSNGEFTPLNDKDRKEYEAIRGVTIVTGDDTEFQPGLFINEDFSGLTGDGEAKYLEWLKHIRHKGINVVIVTHTLKQIPENILQTSNCLLLYKNAGMSAQKLATLITTRKAYAIKAALSSLNDYEYYFLSIEDELWHNPTENRDAGIIKKYLQGKIRGELHEIETDKQKQHHEDLRKKNAKTPHIREAIRQGRDYTWITAEYQTSYNYVKKIASEMRTSNGEIPDRRRKDWRRRIE